MRETKSKGRRWDCRCKVVRPGPARSVQPEKSGTGPGTGPVEPEKSGRAKNR